jgi:hypothetical protein
MPLALYVRALANGLSRAWSSRWNHRTWHEGRTFRHQDRRWRAPGAAVALTLNDHLGEVTQDAAEEERPRCCARFAQRMVGS